MSTEASGPSEEVVRKLETNFTHASVSARHAAMLSYVAKMTKAPGECTKNDVRELEQAGFSSEAILHMIYVAAYYAFKNRLADALGMGVRAGK